MSALKQTDAETLRKNEAKWSKPLMAAGWNALPSINPCPALSAAAFDARIIVVT
jgi:hypothetical protein